MGLASFCCRAPTAGHRRAEGFHPGPPRSSEPGSRSGSGRSATPGGTVVKFVRDPRPPRCAPFAPVNFLNPERKVQETNPGTALAWGSVTTGNLAGVDLWLDDASRGMLRLETNVVSGEVELASLRDNLVQFEGGGLGRRLSIYRLPEDDWTRHVAFIHTVSFAGGVDLPVYVRVTQADGNQAWSSPIHLVE